MDERMLDQALKTTLQTSAESKILDSSDVKQVLDDTPSITDRAYATLAECSNMVANEDERAIDRKIGLAKAYSTMALVDQLVLLNRSMPLIAQCIVNSNASLVKPASSILTR